MKQRAKRLMALFMAGVFTLSTCMTSGPYTVLATEVGTADVTTSSEGTSTTPSEGSTTMPDNTTPSGTPEEGGTTDPEPEAPTQVKYGVNLPQTIHDVEYGTVKVNYAGKEIEPEKEGEQDVVKFDTEITDLSLLQITSENYNFSNITVENGQITIATATPKLGEISGLGEITVDENSAYTITNSAWNQWVEWTASDEKVIITKDSEVTGTANVVAQRYIGNDAKKVYVEATVDGTSIEKEITVKKKNVILSIAVTPENAGWETPVRVTVTTNPQIPNAEIVISQENSEKKVFTDENGEAQIEWGALGEIAQYTFKAKYAGDETYYSTVAELQYNTGKENQTGSFAIEETGERIEYSKSEETVVATVDKGWNYSFKCAENQAVADALKVVEGNVIYTSNENINANENGYNVVVSRENENYNPCDSKKTLVIKVHKKTLELKNVQADAKREYDGTKNVKVTAEFNQDEWLTDRDANVAKNLSLETVGTAADENANEEKATEVAYTFSFPELTNVNGVSEEDYESLKNDYETLKNNYELPAENTTPVIIHKKELTLTVKVSGSKGNVLEREYTNYKELPDDVKIEVSGFVTKDWNEEKGTVSEELINAGYKVPGVTVDSKLVKTTFSNAKDRWNVIENALVPDENSSCNPTDNYKFDFKNAIKANLKLIPRSIEEKVWKELLTVASDSRNVYQDTSSKRIYYSEKQPYSEDKPEIKWDINENELPIPVNTDLEYTYDEVQVLQNDKWISGSYNPKTDIENDTISVRLVNSKSGGMTEPYTIALCRDNKAPSAKITIEGNESVYEFAEKITFGLFNQTGFTAKISEIEDKPEKENSGIKTWSYWVKNLKEDATFTDEVSDENFAKQLPYDKFTEGRDTGTGINLGSATEPGNFAVFVLVEDNVGNKALYGSNGVVVEQIPVDSLTLEYGKLDENTIGKEEENAKPIEPKNQKDGVSYFDNDISIYAIAKDNTKDGNYSGIKTITANLTNLDDTKEQPKELIAYSAEDDLNKGHTLADLAKYSTVTTSSENVTVDKDECVKYQVSANAKDGAGNTLKVENESVKKTFVIDKKAPEVENDINNKNHLDAGRYYSKEDVVLTTKVTERFTDESRIIINLQKDGEEAQKYTLEKWIALCESDKDSNQGYKISFDKNEKISSSNDYYGTITFTIPADENTEGNYSYWVEVKDYAENPNVSDNTIKFCIDVTAPEVDVTYKSAQNGAIAVGNGDAIAYLNGKSDSFTGTITVTEKNMMPVADNIPDVNCVYDGSLVKAYRYTGDIGEPATESCTDVKIKGNKEKLVLSGLADNIKKKDNWSNDDITHKYEFSCSNEANYEFPNFTVTDLAGNTSKEAKGVAKITLDWTKALGTIQITDMIAGGKDGSASWTDTLLNALTFGLYGKDHVYATITSKDGANGGSGIAEKSYYLATNLMSEDSLNKLSSAQWTSYNGRIRMADNRNYIVYEKVVDKAGNLAYYSSDRVIVDHQNPQPEVTITPTTPGWGKGVYSASDNPGFDVNVVDPAGSDGSCAGLAEVKYTIKNGTTGYQENGTLATYGATDTPVATYKGHVTIDPEKFYSNDVQVTVEATDHSTNGKTTETTSIKVDNKAPIVTFSFDKSDVHNGKYYNNDKTLTITVDERNFDESYKPQVTSTASGGYSISGWSHNGEIHTATVTFSGDSDYTVTYDCYDLAGNKSNTEKLDEFTVDKTKPAIQVSYDNNSALNNNYYKEARTATITITEHNFNPGEVTVTTTAQLDGAAASAPGVSGWSGSGDTHVATVSYSADADYTFTISATDLASNVSDPYATESFTVDQIKPTVEITNIEDRSANNGEVAPVITLNDINFDSGKTVVHLTGANKGEVDTTGMYTSTASNKGQTLTFYNFKENMDDIYTLTAETTDKAGNQYSTSKIFSVNRDGSTYLYDDYTEELIKNGYTNDPKNLVVSEINVDTLTFQELTVSENGTQKTLEQNKDFEVSESGSDVSWKEYKYTINASNFENEGDYNVSIYSEDRATNVTTNTAKSKDILFAVDKTSPVISLANIEDGGRYKVESQTFTANVDDNMALDKVEYYVDDELKQTFDADEVSANGGSLELSVDSSNTFQNVSVKAYDKANNEATTASVDVLVSANTWVQFYNNKPAFYGTIGGGVAAVAAAVAAGVHFSGAAAGTAAAAGKTAAGAGIFLAGKKRKKDEE